jgi:hypothetical protein
MALFNGELDFSSTIDAMDSRVGSERLVWHESRVGIQERVGGMFLIASDRKRIAVKVYLQVKFLILSPAFARPLTQIVANKGERDD